MSDSVLDAIVGRIRGALAYNENAYERPVALLWTDESSQWEAVVERLRDILPVGTLGTYDPVAARGPAYWLRCVAARTVPLEPLEETPIIYLPGVGRGALRAVDSCPPELAPLAELQYRCASFSHPSGRDWTLRSFLTHRDRGLGLEVADGPATASALQLALAPLIDLSLRRVSHQLLDEDFLLGLVNPDQVRSILDWLDDPAEFRERIDYAQWVSFCRRSAAEYNLDPEHDGELTGARMLGEREGPWAEVWKRFAEFPQRYPGIPPRLDRAKPLELHLAHSGSWPQDNEAAEDQLRAQLLDLAVATPQGARGETARLEEEHGSRRATVWAALDAAPLAFAVEQLAALSELTAHPPPAGGVDALADEYADRGWRADDAVLRALAAATSAPDREAVSVALRAIYHPWLHEWAQALQEAIGPMVNAGTYDAAPPAPREAGTIVVFVDGLRFDIAHRFAERLRSGGLDVEVGTALAALPSVTQTSKPAVMPVAQGALKAGPDLHPANVESGRRATLDTLRSLMAANGVEVVGPGETGTPAGAGWTEVGEIDRRGHEMGLRLADYVDEEVDRIVTRVRDLLGAGWSRVEVVTDHGWILLPEGMDKIDLPVAATEYKKGRCARLKEGAQVGVPTVPWHWDDGVRIALAPGASCFEAGKVYEHGGVSPQECVVPRLSIKAGTVSQTTGGPEITKVKWLGLLCRVELSGAGPGLTVDIRAQPAAKSTRIAEEAKETTSAGRAALVVPDEELEGERAYVVLVADDERVVAQREVVVGKNR
jgi:hypothetical protein